MKALKAQCKAENPRLTGIFHDWGVPVGTMWANQCEEDQSPDAPDELIMIDVLAPHRTMVKSNLTFFDMIVTISYRIVNALAFQLGPILGTVCMIVGYGIIGLLCIGPLNFDKESCMLFIKKKARPSSFASVLFARSW